MSQFPHDKFNKNLLEMRLSPFGEVKTQYSLNPETTFLDVYFVPQQPIADEPYLQLLSRCIDSQAVAFEFYRNPVAINKIQNCVVKALQIQQRVCPDADPKAELKPRMWITTPTLAAATLEKFGAVATDAGIYTLHSGLQTGIVVIHQLPVTPATLLFRLMGKGRVQQNAIAEVAALPADSLSRSGLSDLLVSYTMELTTNQSTDPEERELIMQLSPLYLEKLENARQEGKTEGQTEGQVGVVLRQLKRLFGTPSESLEVQVRSLESDRLEALEIALFDFKFKKLEDLTAWLANN
jgi:hypothetical protein